LAIALGFLNTVEAIGRAKQAVVQVVKKKLQAEQSPAVSTATVKTETNEKGTE